ncbi:MAG: A/G-specific adenine glycosylase [Bacteroidales bacterium]
MSFNSQLLHWYKNNHRDLPWRNTRDPYLIWISEIILQQTRVNQGYQYYLRFIERFPDVKTLANSKEKDVLKLWQGLGYYSRARNIFFAAQQIMNEYQGVFPTNYNEIIKLKGIGSYSASAIASIAFKLAYPVIDGNVLRVISRVYGISTPVDSSKGKNEVQNILNTLIDKENPDIFNQAIMELGALVCNPQSPKCECCPLQTYCFAFENKNMDLFPVKSKKIKLRIRYFYYLIITYSDQTEDFIYLNKRSKTDIWKNMYDFPLIESNQEILVNDDFFHQVKKFLGIENYIVKAINGNYKHQLTHQTIFACFVNLKISQALPETNDYFAVPLHKINSHPIPKLIDNYLNNHPL